MPLMNIIFLNYATIIGNSHQLNEAIEELGKKRIEKVSTINTNTLSFKNKIKLKNLSFKYQPNSPYVIKNINLEILKGNKSWYYWSDRRGKKYFFRYTNGIIVTDIRSILY